MSKSVEQFEEFFQLINELTGPYPPASGATAAMDSAPRKDFGAVGGDGYPPNMNRKGLLDPYQSHPSSTMPDPDRPPHLPYPLETVNDFLADSAVYLDTALKQMKLVLNNNPSLDPVFKVELNKMYKQGVECLTGIKKIGLNLTNVTNLNY